ncbi:MAG: response regulator transcription factor [Parcubacteria group bacterium]|nr:response regulator transcription factor [Parcubacteria group bacterium]
MKKILLVEDEKTLLEMYEYYLSEAGFKVILSSNAKNGLKLAKKEKPDLILLDILLPGEDGIYFLEELRKNKRTATFAVIVFSNYDVPKLKQKAFKLGAKDYLLKTSYTPKQVIEKISKYI